MIWLAAVYFITLVALEIFIYRKRLYKYKELRASHAELEADNLLLKSQLDFTRRLLDNERTKRYSQGNGNGNGYGV